MFVVPFAPRYSKAETILEKIRNIMYNQSSTAVVLSLKKLPVDETSSLRMIIYTRCENICFDNVNLLETSYDYSKTEIPASILI